MRLTFPKARWAAFTALSVLALFAAGCSETSGPKQELTLTLSEVDLREGEAILVQASGVTTEIVWSSSNTNVATVNTLGVISGIKSGTAVVTAAAGDQLARVSVTVSIPPLLSLSAPIISMTAFEGQEPNEPGRISIQNGGGGTLRDITVSDPQYAAGQDADWLRVVNLASSTAPSVITTEATASGLKAGTYLADLSVGADAANAPQNVVVALNVLRDPALQASPTRADLFAEPGGDPGTVTIEITNKTAGEISQLRTAIAYFGGPGDTGWLDYELSSTSTPATLTLNGDTQFFDPGTYQADITLSSLLPGVTPLGLRVTLTIAEGPAIAVASESASFGATEGGSDPSPRFISISNAGGLTLRELTTSVSYQGSSSGWLETTIGGTAPTQLQLQPRVAGLGVGTYRATVNVESAVASNSPVPVEVTLQVFDSTPPTIAVSQSSLSFTGARAGSSPSAQAVSVTNSGSGTLSGLSTSIVYAGASGWLSANLGSSSAPTSLTVSPSQSGLAVGTYQASVIIGSSIPGVAPRTVAVTLEVVPSFVNDIYGVFSANYSGYNTPCTGCHYAGGSGPVLGSGATAQTVWNGLINDEVIPNNPGASSLVCKIDGTCSSSTDMRLPPAQVNLIRQWINGGAPFN